MIEVVHLTKRYGKHTVLDNVDVTFEAGHVYGLVGPNGCGKTTLMRCICGFTNRTAVMCACLESKLERKHRFTNWIQ